MMFEFPKLEPLPERYRHPNEADEFYYSRSDERATEIFFSPFEIEDHFNPLTIRQISIIVGAIAGRSWTSYMLRILGNSDNWKCYERVEELSCLGIFESTIQFQVTVKALGYGRLRDMIQRPDRFVTVQDLYKNVLVESSNARVIGRFVPLRGAIDSNRAYEKEKYKPNELQEANTDEEE